MIPQRGKNMLFGVKNFCKELIDIIGNKNICPRINAKKREKKKEIKKAKYQI